MSRKWSQIFFSGTTETIKQLLDRVPKALLGKVEALCKFTLKRNVKVFQNLFKKPVVKKNPKNKTKQNNGKCLVSGLTWIFFSRFIMVLLQFIIQGDTDGLPYVFFFILCAHLHPWQTCQPCKGTFQWCHWRSNIAKFFCAA